MSNNIVLKKGLSVPVDGTPAPFVSRPVLPPVVAIQPDDFKGLKPRLLVKEGDRVLAGTPVLADKVCTDILVTSPVSGTVKEVVRGDKRKLLAVLVETDSAQEFYDFGASDPAATGADELKSLLLRSGLWLSLVQRPYGIIADPSAAPKGIFVSTFSSAPLAPDSDFVYGDALDEMQAAVTALSGIAPVHVGVCARRGEAFRKLKDCSLYSVSGRHPAGNVGVQISHISPIRKGETVWTVGPAQLVAIGRLLRKGRVELRRKVAVTGPMAIEPSYVETVPGMPMSCLAPNGACAEGVRVVSGDILSGRNAGAQGYLGWYDNQVTLVREGTDEEWFGWANPLRLNQFSVDHSYFHWCLKPLLGKRRYAMDTNLHGGPRAFVMSDGYYAKVLPMDIYPLYLTKACLASDIDKMEKFGIYEVLPEDLATCEFIDPSKNNIQSIIADGIDLMLKEMA